MKWKVVCFWEKKQKYESFTHKIAFSGEQVILYEWGDFHFKINYLFILIKHNSKEFYIVQKDFHFQ